MEKKEVRCSTCNGGGIVTKDTFCNGCAGTGQGTGMGSTSTRHICSLCYGKGTIPRNINCERCNGKGTVEQHSGCFITTATLTALGKGDKCHELETFRRFRDTYVAENYPNDIEEYYAKAPLIVDEIQKKADAIIVFNHLWKNDLSLAYKAIMEGKDEKAYSIYRNAMERLIYG